MGPMYCWWGGWWVFPIITAIIMLAALYLIFGRGGLHSHYGSRGDSPPRGDSESAMDILKRRYAKGEITKDEFYRLKRDLTDD